MRPQPSRLFGDVEDELSDGDPAFVVKLEASSKRDARRWIAKSRDELPFLSGPDRINRPSSRYYICIIYFNIHRRRT